MTDVNIKMKLGHRHTEKDDRMKTCHLQAKERWPQKTPTHPHLDLGCPAIRTIRNKCQLFKSPPRRYCYSSPLWLRHHLKDLRCVAIIWKAMNNEEHPQPPWMTRGGLETPPLPLPLPSPCPSLQEAGLRLYAAEPEQAGGRNVPWPHLKGHLPLFEYTLEKQADRKPPCKWNWLMSLIKSGRIRKILKREKS